MMKALYDSESFVGILFTNGHFRLSIIHTNSNKPTDFDKMYLRSRSLKKST